MIKVKEIAYQSEEYKKALNIRRRVFVEGQNVPEEDEVDDFESSSQHFIAYLNEIAVGAARWRATDHYIKLERFAVLEEFRGKGIGSALVEDVLDSIRAKHEKGSKLLLHSQIPAIPLYAKFAFKEQGELFEECGIMHRTMTRLL